MLMNEPWQPPPAPLGIDRVSTVDPRVDATHLAGQLPCPPNPPPPVGWAYWTGKVPQAAGQLAVDMLNDQETYPMGTFLQFLLNGELMGIRVEWHPIRMRDGAVGCFWGVNLMRPRPAEEDRGEGQFD